MTARSDRDEDQRENGIDAEAVEACEAGPAVIRRHLEHLPAAPGVYRMLDRRGEVLYVGKARNLKHRVASYVSQGRLTNRIARMVMQTADMAFVTTHTEVEALLLEANLIKQLKPRYNIILRDDKSFPHILVTGDHDWPQVVKHRGARGRPGQYFGPFASAGAVNRTLNILERAFLLRSCSDSVFEARTRPCLLYQIKRCSAPCVGYIGREDYLKLVGEARKFLEGRSQEIQRGFSERMQRASEALDFETAAHYRDRIRALSRIQSHQGINVDEIGEADVIAGHQEAGQASIQVFFFRNGQNWGNRAYFPRHDRSDSLADVMAAFIGQFYDNKPAPRLILVNGEVTGRPLLEEALGLRAGRKVCIQRPQRGAKREVVAQAALNAREALARRVAENTSQRRLLEGLAELFGLDAAPERIEVYDNSHISGTNAVGAMIVAGPEGFERNAYRKFNIKTAELAPGDDYGMMREVLKRRFSRLLKERETEERENADEAAAAGTKRPTAAWPDLVLIDGGAGQLSSAREIFAELGIDDVALAAIAKGPERNAGRERFFMAGRQPFSLAPDSPVLYFLQRLRDEAHRFAIGTHRARRTQAIGRSRLDEVPGIGQKRKRALLHHFGSARGVSDAALADLEHVEGISKTVARRIYDHFHGDASRAGIPD